VRCILRVVGHRYQYVRRAYWQWCIVEPHDEEYVRYSADSSMCAGTPLSAAVIIDPASRSKIDAAAAEGFPSTVRAAALTLAATRRLPARYPDVYHRLDLWDPVSAAGAQGGAAVYSDYFAIHLAPRALQDVAGFRLVRESASSAKALSALMATGPNATHVLPDGAESGSAAAIGALASALPAGGLSAMALRDLQIARHLAALWNVSSWGGAEGLMGDGWEAGILTAGVGMESGVWYTWPARRLPGQGSDVQDQLWYARAVQRAGQLVVSREDPCPAGCVGDGSFLSPYHVTLSLALTDVPVNGSAGEAAGGAAGDDTVTAVAPILGVIMVGFKAEFFQARLIDAMRGGECHPAAADATCFLMDYSAAIVAHPGLPNTPDSEFVASAGASAQQTPLRDRNAGVFVGEVHGAVAQEMLSSGLLVQQVTKGASPSKNGMVYGVNETFLDANAGEIQVGGIRMSVPIACVIRGGGWVT